MSRRPCISPFFLFAALSFVSGCRTLHQPEQITQVATIDALLAGVYDGHMTLAKLRTYGDFGLGTYDKLDGEMILLGGTFYQVLADGRVAKPSPETLTPFATVSFFDPVKWISVQKQTGKEALEQLIDAHAPDPNQFCAFRIEGVFSRIKTRSVPAQEKPYRPLSEITANQPVFELTEQAGTLMGFRSPAYVKGINVPGYHMHFLSDDLSGGGHVLDVVMERGTVAIDDRFTWMSMYIPPDSPLFRGADLSTDRAGQLKAVESDPEAPTY